MFEHTKKTERKKIADRDWTLSFSKWASNIIMFILLLTFVYFMSLLVIFISYVQVNEEALAIIVNKSAKSTDSQIIFSNEKVT